MLPSRQLSTALRSAPLVALVFAGAAGAMYCAAHYALAASLTGARVVAADPAALAHWRRLAALYGAGLVASLAVFAGGCLALRRRRKDATPPC